MKHHMSQYRNLEQALQAYGNPVSLLRSSPIGTYVFPVVAPEYSNWISEQRAWMNSVALLNLSYHMTHLYLKGPDALKFLKRVGCNKWGTFPKGRGKQIVLAGHDGFIITDNICFHTSDDTYRITGSPVGIDWIEFNATTSGFSIEVDRDDNLFARKGEPRLYVYQIQGPRALDLMQEVCDGELPDIPFFHIGEFTIKGKSVRALRHGMAGVPGFELFGPWSDSPVILEALETTGEKYQLHKVGGLAYPTSCLESGWLAMPCPAIYHSKEMQPYREWLTPMHLPAIGSLGGSYDSKNIVDYYMDPIEVGYGKFLDLDGDCLGRDALTERIKHPRRKKVTLVLNREDVVHAIGLSMQGGPDAAKSISMPLAMYSTWQMDEVTKSGRHAGLSAYVGFSANANEMLSIAVVDIEKSEVGTDLTLRWGEANPNRVSVERNKIVEIRAKVAPVPYFEKTIKKD